ncbi:MAG TPA: hypothetical protein PKE20_08275, partial [Promineifilum sp.]|nr:hypothetical protein [Promineifilum sp.]
VVDRRVDAGGGLVARAATDDLVGGTRPHAELYFAGYTQDAVKEFVESNLVYALVRNRPLPGPEQLGCEPNTWLNGLAEAASELRRRILDLFATARRPRPSDCWTRWTTSTARW